MKFTDYDHRYVRNRRKYTSVTTLVGMYKNKYDKKYWSNYKSYQKLLGDNDFKALKKLYADDQGITNLRKFSYSDYNFFKFIDKTVSIDKKLLNTLKKEILDNWKHENEKSKVKGTKYHEFKENEAIESGFKINNFNNKKYETKTSINKKKSDKGIIITPTTEDLYTLEDGFYPEMLIWNDKFRISGQADMVFIDTIDGVRYISIDDFKTNKKINTSNIFNKMKYPVGYLDDCEYNHYWLQVSFYAWMLEQFGFKVKDLGFTHISTPYKFDMARDEVNAILIDFNKEAYYDFL